MSAFTNLITNMVSAFIPSVISMFTGLDNKGWTPDRGAQHVAEDLASLQDQDLISNYMRKTTGSSLTQAEREANLWNQQETLSAWNRTMEADNTKYQRQVVDMQLAGLNPLMAAGGTPSSPTAAVAGGVSPSSVAFNLDSIVNMLGLGAKIKNLEADTNLKNANAGKAASETRGQDIVNSYADEFHRLQNEGLGLSNELNLRQQRLVAQQIDDIDSQIQLRIEQTKSELEKRQLMIAQGLLARANTYQIVEMIPYAQALSSAQTNQAKANAAFASVQAAYQNGLISAGYIEHMVDKLVSDGRISASQAEISEIKSAIKNGKNPPDWRPDGVLQAIVGAASNLLDAINPLAGIFK